MLVDQEKLAKATATSPAGGKGTSRREVVKEPAGSGSETDGKERSAKKPKLASPSLSSNEDIDMPSEGDSAPIAQAPEASTSSAVVHSSYSYGQLESAFRWHLDFMSFNHWSVRSMLPNPRGPFTLSEVKTRILGDTKQRFRFTDLDTHLQLRVIEKLRYADLQCLARTSNAMKQLVSTRTKRLDTALFRTELSLSPDVEPNLEKSERGRRDKGLKFHPIINNIKHRHDPFATFEELKFQLKDPSFRGKKNRKERPLRLLREISENATEPPCFQVKLSYSSNRPTSDDEESYSEDDVDNERPKKKRFRQKLTLYKGTRDAEGRPLPVTVEQFVRTQRKAIMKEPDCDGGYICVWLFMDWKTKYIDEDGCLHLLNAQWRPRQRGYYLEKSDGGYSTRTEAKRSDSEDEGGDDGFY